MQLTYLKTCLLNTFLIVMFCIVPSISSALPSNRILDTSHWICDNIETIQIQTIYEPEFTTFTLKTPDRIIITLKDTYLHEIHSSKIISGEKIKSVRMSQNTKSNTRVVLDLKNSSDHSVNSERLPDGNYQITIDLPIKERISSKSHLPKQTSIRPILIAQLEPDPSFIQDLEIAQKQKPNSLMVDTFDEAIPQTDETNELDIDLEESQSFNLLDNSDLDESIFEDDDKSNPEKIKDLKFSGSFKLRGSADVDKAKTNENETSFQNLFFLQGKFKDKVVISGLSDYLLFGPQNPSDEYLIDLYEAYYKHMDSALEISIGKQIKRWGKTDQISPVDTLNPEDTRLFILPAYEDRKIPVWMADIIFKRDMFFIEGIVIPFFEPSRFNYFGTDWAIFSHLKENIKDSTLTAEQKAYFDMIRVHENKPDNDFDNFEYAVKFGGTIKTVDFGFSYHDAFEDKPFFKSFPIKNLSLDNPGSIQAFIASLGSVTLTNEQIETEYLKSHIFGFEFETIVINFGLRGEIVYRDNESFLTNSFTSVQKPTFSYVIGVDYTSANEIYFNLMFAHQHISDFEKNILILDQDNYSIIGEINKNLLSDWLKASVQYTMMISDGSLYFSPRLIYSYISNLEMTFGANIFAGDNNSFFGQYDENDQVFMNLIYHF